MQSIQTDMNLSTPKVAAFLLVVLCVVDFSTQAPRPQDDYYDDELSGPVEDYIYDAPMDSYGDDGVPEICEKGETQQADGSCIRIVPRTSVCLRLTQIKSLTE